MHRTRVRAGRLVLLLASGAALACGSDNGDGGNGPNPKIAIGLSESAFTIQQGGTHDITATITRTDFSGDITIATEGAPAGVTAAASNVSTSGNTTTGTITVTVGAATAPGTYNLTVRASGSGVDPVTAPVTLTVTATPAFDLSLGAAALSVGVGASGNVTVTIARTNFTAGVALTLEGAPAGVTGTFDPAEPTGDASTLTVAVDGTVAPGTYDLSVKGTSAGLPDKSTPLTLTVTAAPAGSYSLAVAPNPVSIQQGANGPVTVTLTRTNFTEDVALSLTGAPTGLTAAFAPATVTGSNTTSTLTLTVDAALAPGDYPLTVTGTATGLADQTAALTLTVTAAPAQGYTLAATAATIQVGQNGTSDVTITRTGGFAGTVNLSVANAPAGVTGTFNPAAVTGTTSTLTLAVGASVAAGSYTVTIKGTATGQTDQTADLALTVSPASSGGAIHWDFSACGGGTQPIWFAVKDGSGAWTQVVGVNNVFSFDLASSTGGIAFVVQNSGVNTLFVRYLSQAEIVGASFTGCGVATPSGKSITGTAVGVAATDLAIVNLASSTAAPTAQMLNFTLQNVQLGTFDLLAYRRSITSPGTGDKLVIKRDINTNTVSDVGTVDFTSGIDPATAVLTITGAAGGEQFTTGMNYETGAACTAGLLYSAVLPSAGTTPTIFGVPAADQRPTDYHTVSVSAINGTTSFRTVVESFQTMADRSIALPSALPATSPTVLTGPYKRLQYAVTLPSDLLASATLSYFDQAGTRSVFIIATSNFLGGATIDLSTPDFTGVAGWDNAWAPASGASVTWQATGSGGNLANLCSNGVRVVTSTRLGTI